MDGAGGRGHRAPAAVVLHVGSPKSGTTFLQQALWSNRAALRTEGVALPGERQREMFLAAVEVREGYKFWGYPPEEIDGTWANLCRQARDRGAITVMSHELLGGARDHQAARALTQLDGVELHVVFTARDLSLQVTSEWQERIKNGSTRKFAKFQRQITRQIDSDRFSSGFWRNQDPTGVLARWSGQLPPHRVHVVVAPRPGADPRELWHRFASAVGFDGHRYDPVTTDAATNPALGVAQTAVLRRVNQALDGRIPQPGYARLVKEVFAEKLLSAQTSTARPEAPAALVARLREVAEQRNDMIRALGYQVHGDLDELVPAPAVKAVSPKTPDKIEDRQVLDSFAEAVASLLVQRHDARRERLLDRVTTTPTAAPLRRRVAQRFRS